MTFRREATRSETPARWRQAFGRRGLSVAVGALAILALLLLAARLHEGFTAPGPHPRQAAVAGANTEGRAASTSSSDPGQVSASAASGTGADMAEDPASAAGLSPADLIALRAELMAHPRGEAELRRVLAFLAFQRQWQRFDTERRAGAEPAGLRPLASMLDARLAEHWREGELSGVQALQVKAQLLEVLLDDATSRRRALAEWQAQLGIGAHAAAATRQAALDQPPGDRR